MLGLMPVLRKASCPEPGGEIMWTSLHRSLRTVVSSSATASTRASGKDRDDLLITWPAQSNRRAAPACKISTLPKHTHKASTSLKDACGTASLGRKVSNDVRSTICESSSSGNGMRPFEKRSCSTISLAIDLRTDAFISMSLAKSSAGNTSNFVGSRVVTRLRGISPKISSGPKSNVSTTLRGESGMSLFKADSSNTSTRTRPLMMKYTLKTGSPNSKILSPEGYHFFSIVEMTSSPTSDGVSSEKSLSFPIRWISRLTKIFRMRTKRTLARDLLRKSAPLEFKARLSAAKRQPPAIAVPSITHTMPCEPDLSISCKVLPKSSTERAKSNAPPPNDMRAAQSLLLGRQLTPISEPMFKESALISAHSADCHIRGGPDAVEVPVPVIGRLRLGHAQLD
mmetsp:Transcript_137173/g.273697  ORF Transcript_137173/g.273697 Transcript_137173/m.273697 type:complete len:397 (+) Transcript_137173:1362-2552(+)